MSEKHTCGHTDDEHRAEAISLQDAVTKGDLSPLIPSLSNQHLMAVVHMASVEMFIRAENDETAWANWERHDKLVRNTFMVESEEDSEWPEYYKLVQTQREKFSTDLEEGRLPHSAVAPPENVEPYEPGGYL